MLKITTAQRKISKLRGRCRIVQGGSSASKTFSILPMLIHYAATYPNAEISVVSESIPHLKRGAIRDFLKIMEWTGNFNQASWNVSNHIYKFANGSFIEFFSADQPDKLRGARRDILFINECNNVSFDAYNQLSIRTRKFIYLDYNPTAEFWVHTDLIGQPNTDFIILTYKDNEALEPALVAEIEKARERGKTSNYWRNYWLVYGLGEVGSLEGVIFSNWKTIDTIPADARLIGCGLDFGFQDPTACVEVYTWNGQRIINERIYQTGLLINEIAKRLPTNVPVYCDSAEPRSISELQRAGIKAYGVTKGRDSINYGIDIMQQQEYLITSASTNLIKELRGYCWDTDKTGKRMSMPVGTDHGIDSLRYIEMETLGMKSDHGKYHIR